MKSKGWLQECFKKSQGVLKGTRRSQGRVKEGLAVSKGTWRSQERFTWSQRVSEGYLEVSGTFHGIFKGLQGSLMGFQGRLRRGPCGLWGQFSFQGCCREDRRVPEALEGVSRRLQEESFQEASNWLFPVFLRGFQDSSRVSQRHLRYS